MSEAISGHDVQELIPVSSVGNQWRGQSATICKLAVALSKAQGEFPDIGKSADVTIQPKEGRSYKFQYAPLDVILRAVRPALAKHGLAVLQPIFSDGPDGVIETLVLHESGEFLRTSIVFQRPGDIKALGSMITYLRRYSIKAALGIEGGDEDDDGSAAQGDDVTSYRPRAQQAPASVAKPAPIAAKPAAKAEAPEPMSDAQYKRIGELGQELGYAAPAFKDHVKEVTGVAWSRSMSGDHAAKLISALEGMRGAA